MDPVRTEVMRNRFAAIAEEASTVAYRTAYTTFVKQTQDYQVALASVDGEFFAYPMAAGVASSVCQNVRGLIDEFGIDTLKPGDIIISNDPFSGDALCTHTMDLHLLRPVFRDGVIVAIGWAFIHASDIGGSVAGSISPTNYEVFQEGVRIRPSLLYRQGVLDEQLWSFFAYNSRIPELIWGDLQAMMAGLALLDDRTQELCARMGTQAVLDSITDVLDLGEIKAREAIAALADGTYEFSDYLETYDADGHVFIHARMTVAGDGIDMDFTGSDPQMRLSLNFTTGIRPHPFLCMPIIYWIMTTMPTVPINGGIIRPIRTSAPRGTLMNAEFPAAMGNRWVSVMRLWDAILGCLNQALPNGLAAAGAGQAGIISVASVDPRTGRRHVSVVEPFAGGSGGRCSADGIDGIDQPVAGLRSAPVEVVEVETGLVIRAFRYVPGSAAPGQYRGGYAMLIELENRGPPAIMTVRGLDRFRFQPWGVAGGASGSAAHAVLNPNGAARNPGKIDVLELQPADVLRMVTPSGGGFGDPFTRPSELVQAEVQDGMLTAAAAQRDYGVIVTNGTLDEPATTAARAIPRADPPLFNLGSVRLALEQKWPEAVSMALASAALQKPSSLRAHAMVRARATLASTENVVRIEDVAGAFA